MHSLYEETSSCTNNVMGHYKHFLMRHLKSQRAIVSMSRPFPNTDHACDCKTVLVGFRRMPLQQGLGDPSLLAHNNIIVFFNLGNGWWENSHQIILWSKLTLRFLPGFAHGSFQGRIGIPKYIHCAFYAICGHDSAWAIFSLI